MSAIQEISAALSSELNLDRLLRLIMDKTTLLLNADRSTLYLMEDGEPELWAKVIQGNDLREIRIQVGEGIAGWVAETGQAVNIEDAHKDERFNSEFDVRTGYHTQTMLCLPMRNHQSDIVGVIQVLNKTDGPFTAEDEQLLAAISSQAAVSIENSKLYLDVVSKNVALLDTQSRLEQRLSEIDALYQMEQKTSEESSEQAIVQMILKETQAIIPSALAVLLSWTDGEWHVDSFPPLSGPKKAPAIDEGSIAFNVANTGEAHRSNSLLNKDLTDTVATAAGLELQSSIAVLMPDGSEKTGVLQLINRRNQVGYTETNLKLLTVLAGQLGATLRRTRARQEELKANRLAAIGQALSGVMHDLRTPMTIISGNAQLMADEDDPTERQTCADAIARQIAAMGTMTNEILAFSRGQSKLLLQKTQLHHFVTELTLELEQEFAGHNIELSVHTNYRGPVRMDEGKVRRLIFNLARNAREAMTDGGRVALGFDHDPTREDIVITITDNGSGIPAEIQDQLFESFVSSGKAEGTGLGLAIVKKIVDEHGGSISFTSMPAGTSFQIRIPRGVDG